MVAVTDPPNVDALPEPHRVIIESHATSGYRLRERRRQNLRIPQSDGDVVELGSQAAALNHDWRTMMRRNKDERNALMDRRNELRGTLNEAQERIETKRDALGRPLTEADLAAFTRQWARKSDEYTAFESERKETLKANAEELAEIEERRDKLAAEIQRSTRVSPVWVADLEREDGTRILVRLDTGDVIDTRKADRVPGQPDLFGDHIEHEPLDSVEYGYVVQERYQDAAASYACRFDLTVDVALGIVRKLAKTADEELPPEIDEPPAPPEPVQEQPAPPAEPEFWDVIVREYEPTTAFREVARKMSTLKPSQLSAALKGVPETAAVIVRKVSRAMAESHVDELVRVGAQAASVPHVGDPVAA